MKNFTRAVIAFQFLILPWFFSSQVSCQETSGSKASLWAYYPLNGNANEYYGNYNGTDYGTSYGTDALETTYSAAYFTSGAYISVGDYFEDVSQLSFSCWIKPTDITGTKPILSKYNSYYQLGGYQIFIENGRIYCSVHDLSDNRVACFTANSMVSVNQWQHIAVVIDLTQSYVPSRIMIYLNGVYQNITFTKTDDFGTIPNTSNYFNIGISTGSTGASSYFEGAIDEVYVYNSTLSQAEITNLANNFPVDLVDIDGNAYDTVKIGTQVWMKQNLKTTRYNDGTTIPLVEDAATWSILTTPGMCWYYNDQATYGTVYGALYNWYTVNAGNLCPTGWHVPTDAEWTTLTDFLGGVSVAGGKLKEAGYAHWAEPNTGATNSSGFTALPSGFRSMSGNYFDLTLISYFMTSTENGIYDVWVKFLNYDTSTIFSRDGSNKQDAWPIRCIQDVTTGQKPTINTTQPSATDITSTNAILGGEVTSEGSSSIIERGIIYGETSGLHTTTQPDAAVGTGAFTMQVTGLTPATEYYVKAYATNSEGTAYGDSLIFNTTSAEITAKFTANLTSGAAPLMVQFADASTGSVTIWNWDFDNDGTIDSYDQNPSWTYNTAGVYSVKLTVSDGTYSDEELKESYITVTGGVTSVMPSGSGTEADPYLIASFENLLWVSEHSESWASYFMQTADIDASASSTLNGGYGFFPIGYAGYNFTGTYLGQKHTISGLYQNITEGGVIALFGQCSFATIKDLGLTGHTTIGNNYVAAFIGTSDGSVIQNCYAKGGTISGSYYVGGIMGFASGRIENCFNQSAVSGAMYVGGLAGYGNPDLVNSYAACTVSFSSQPAAGLINYDANFSATNCYWDIQVSGLENSSAGEARTTSQMTYPYDGTTYIEWDFTNTWANDTLKIVNNGYPYLHTSIATKPAIEITNTTTTATTATIYANITSDGGSPLTTRGVAFGTTPGTYNYNVSDGLTLAGMFNIELTGLTTGVTYYASAYAENSAGRAYSTEISFIPTASEIIWSEDFNGSKWNYTVYADGYNGYAYNGSTALPEGWSVYDANGLNYFWHWSDLGPRGRYTGSPGSFDPRNDLRDLMGGTASNGVMILESDFYHTTASGEMSTTLVDMDSYVQFGPIDLSGHPYIELSFNQMFRYCCNNSNTLSLFVSNDYNPTDPSSAHWTEYDTKGSTLANNHTNPDDRHPKVNISQVAGSSSNVYIRFKHTGTNATHYYWMIDDITIKNLPQNDLVVNDSWFDYLYSYSTFDEGYANVEFFGGYTSIPQQVAGDFISFRTAVENYGSNDQTFSSNVSVYKDNSLVYSKNSPVLFLSNANRDTARITTVFSPNGKGNYQINGILNMSVTDENPSNNTFGYHFNITDNLYSRVYADSSANFSVGGPSDWVNGGNDGEAIAQRFDLPAGSGEVKLAGIRFFFPTYSNRATELNAIANGQFSAIAKVWPKGDSDATPNDDAIPFITSEVHVMQTSELGTWVYIPFKDEGNLTISESVENYVWIGLELYNGSTSSNKIRWEVGTDQSFKSPYFGGACYIIGGETPEWIWGFANYAIDLYINQMPSGYDKNFTFNVDMNGAIKAGKFNPSSDVVYVTGSFTDPNNSNTNWAEPGTGSSLFMSDPEGDYIYTGKVYLKPEDTYYYKYFINTTWNNGEWGGEPNRSIYFGSSPINTTDYFGQYTIPGQQPRANIQHLKNATITLDGYRESIWDQFDEFGIQRPFTGELPTLEGAKWQAVWNDDGIYAIVTIHDNVWAPSWISGSADWLSDKIEVYYDVTTTQQDGGGASTGLGNYQFGPDFPNPNDLTNPHNLGEVISGFAPGSQWLATGLLYGGYYDGQGYSCMEYFCPWSDLLDENGIAFDPYSRSVMGFDVTIADNDVIPAVRNRLEWSNDGSVTSENWNNCDQTGLITLVKNGTIPTIISTSYSDITANSASLSAVINPNGIATSVAFKYGKTSATSSSVNGSPGSISGTTDKTVTASLTGLEPNTTYYYKVVATYNTNQTVTSALQSFETNDQSVIYIDVYGESTVCYNTQNESYYVNSINGATYNWSISNGSIASGQGTNAIQVNWGNSGSGGTVSVNVTGPDEQPYFGSLDVTFSGTSGSGKPVIREKGAINILICTTSANSYQWYKDGVPISGQTGQYYVARNNYGNYSVTITDNQGCKISSDNHPLTSKKSLTIYPNPVQQNTTMIFDSEYIGAITVNIVDVFGKVVKQNQFAKDDFSIEQTISVDGLEKGVYLIEVSGNESKMASERLIIN